MFGVQQHVLDQIYGNADGIPTIGETMFTCYTHITITIQDQDNKRPPKIDQTSYSWPATFHRDDGRLNWGRPHYCSVLHESGNHRPHFSSSPSHIFSSLSSPSFLIPILILDFVLVLVLLIILALFLREAFKNPNYGKIPLRGRGGNPLFRQLFSANFLAGRRPLRGRGGYPPFPLRKNLLKIGPKTVFFGQKTPFLANFWRAAVR